MNRTKRKIFEAAMELFAKQGYDGTSVDEITSVVGIAKGTLYYHFSSKEEIYNFLIVEGMNLFKNSIEIQAAKHENAIDKLKAAILVQLKIMEKYESLITLIIGQMWGKDERNVLCRQCIYDYVEIIENIINYGIERGEIVTQDSNAVSSVIFGLTSSALLYKYRKNGEIDVQKLYNEYCKLIVKNLKPNVN
jgi:AcrR family transcriptional regulator